MQLVWQIFSPEKKSGAIPETAPRMWSMVAHRNNQLNTNV